MKKNKRLLTIGILAVLTTTTLTGCAGGKWNPGNWDWTWTKYLNPLNWEIFKGDTGDQVSEEVELSENTETSPDGLVKKIDFEVNKAFGETGKQTITLVLTPANADVGTITWSVNKTGVTVTPATDGLSAEVYVTTYFKDYATISVHEEYSDLTATGKVYSYGAYDIAQHTGNDYDHILDANASALAITSTSSDLNATVQEKVAIKKGKLETNNTALSFYTVAQLKTTQRNSVHSGWTFPQSKVWVHLAYAGSYAPVILNQTTGVVYNGADVSLHDKLTYQSNDIGNVLSIEITLAEGDNMILIAGRNHTKTQSAVVLSDFNDGELPTGGKLIGAKSHDKDFGIPLIITNAVSPTGATIPDVSFYE